MANCGEVAAFTQKYERGIINTYKNTTNCVLSKKVAKTKHQKFPLFEKILIAATIYYKPRDREIMYSKRDDWRTEGQGARID